MYRGTEYTIEFVPKVRIEILVDDDARGRRRRTRSSTRPARARSATARCGSRRSTTIIRVRTGERDREAL